MSKIQIRGVIVPSDYDGGWFQALSDKGVITPESKFRRELDGADKGQTLEIYLNTPGGSVIAGNEMVNSVLAWKATTKQEVHVTLGAMTASMGAAFVIQVADKIVAHQNSLMMFHGAWGANVGGSESMGDYADLLGKINSGTKRVLLARYNLTPAVVDTWFAEGREGWLDVEEMKKAGMIASVIGADDAAIDTKEIDLAVAALARPDTKAQAKGNDDGKGTEAGTAGTGEAAGAAQAQAAAKAEHVQAQVPGDGATGSDQGAASGVDVAGIKAQSFAEGEAKALADLAPKIKELEKRAADATANASKLQGEKDRLSAEFEKFRKESAEKLTESNARLSKLLGGSVSFSPAPMTWAEAVKSCGGKYSEAARQFPELRQEFEKNNRVKG
jgi:ATP-dependent protease ClpP protease subunit